MTFLDGLGAPTQYADTTLHGRALVNDTDPTFEIGVFVFAIQVLLFHQSFGPFVIHHVGNRILVSTQIGLAFQLLFEDIQNAFRLDRVTINGVFPGRNN